MNGETLVVKEEFGSVITRSSRTTVVVKDASGNPRAEFEIKNNGQALDLEVGGLKVRLKGRLVIEQTNITESLNGSPTVEAGLINGLKPAAYPEFVELLEKSQDI